MVTADPATLVLLQRWGVRVRWSPLLVARPATGSCRLFSGVGECFLDDHHVRVRVSVGEDPALAFAQGVRPRSP